MTPKDVADAAQLEPVVGLPTPGPVAATSAKVIDRGFFYGTLMNPSVMQRVLENDGSHLQLCSAILYDHTRLHVQGAWYPAVVSTTDAIVVMGGHQLKKEEKTVRGVVFKGLTPNDLKRLDAFEGSEYITKQVSVHPVSEFQDITSVALREILGPSSKIRTHPANEDLIQVFVYVWNAPLKDLAPQTWTYNAFLEQKMNDYIDLESSDVALAAGTVVAAEGGEGTLIDPLKGENSTEMTSDVTFGHPMLKYFGLAPGYTNLNNGSFGAVPIAVTRYCEAMGRVAEERPDKFFRFTYKPILADVRSKLAQLVHAEPDECVVVPNATHGINTILHNFDWDEGDVLVSFSTTYYAVSQTLKFFASKSPHPTLSTIHLTFPQSHAEILKVFRAHLQGLPNSFGQKVVVVIDTIISNPGILLPWEEMVQICRDEHAWSLVDGAHGVGVLDLNLGKVQPDFFVSNCHKWLMSKRGSALLYVARQHHRLIRSSFPTSWGYVDAPETTELAKIFEYTGTIDVVPYLSIGAAMDFRDSIGGEQKIREYCNQLAMKGGQRMSEIFGTEIMVDERQDSNPMVNVMLPLSIDAQSMAMEEQMNLAANTMQQVLDKHDCFTAIFAHNGRWWTRLSAQIWNEVSDFESVAEVLKAICIEMTQNYSTSKQ